MIAAWWCRLFHRSITLPVHGEYVCLICLRRYRVSWEIQTQQLNQNHVIEIHGNKPDNAGRVVLQDHHTQTKLSTVPICLKTVHPKISNTCPIFQKWATDSFQGGQFRGR
jgi:hypothetical protein